MELLALGRARAHLSCSARCKSGVIVARSCIWRNNGIRRGCEVATVDQRSMTEAPCVRSPSPMPPPMLSLRTVADSSLSHATPTTTTPPGTTSRYTRPQTISCPYAQCIVALHYREIRRVKERTRTTSLILLVALSSFDDNGVALVALRLRLASMVAKTGMQECRINQRL